jgi:hypothetical protein
VIVFSAFRGRPNYNLQIDVTLLPLISQDEVSAVRWLYQNRSGLSVSIDVAKGLNNPSIGYSFPRFQGFTKQGRSCHFR